MTIRDRFLADLWRLVRGDAERAEFEQWICAHSEQLESRLGKQPALEILASDFRSSAEVACVKQLLREYAERESELECRCITLPTVAAIDMGEESEPVLGDDRAAAVTGRTLLVALVRRMHSVRSVVACRAGGAAERRVLLAPTQ